MARSKRTKYKDILYRSQIEARWAVFFDALELEHKYEPTWAEVDTNRGYIRYKPDFELCLPKADQHLYAEIKVRQPTDAAISKACGWARDFGDTVVLYELRPPTKRTESGWLFEWMDVSDQVVCQKHMWWCECPKCGYTGIQQFGDLPCECFDEDSLMDVEYWDDTFGTDYSLDFTRTPRLLEAYQMAKSHQFQTG